jgi:hypothetical protein
MLEVGSEPETSGADPFTASESEPAVDADADRSSTSGMPLLPAESAEEPAKPVVAEVVVSPVPSSAAVAGATPAAKPPRRRFVPRTEIVIGILAGVSVGLLTSVVQLRREHQHVVVPMVTLSADVTELRTRAEETSAALNATLGDVNKKIDDTRAEVAEARSRLEKQETALAKTAEQVNEVAAQQRAAEQAVKDHDAGEAGDVATRETRPKHLEKGVADGAYVVSLMDALKILDATQPAAHAAAPAAKAEAKPEVKHEKAED